MVDADLVQHNDTYFINSILPSSLWTEALDYLFGLVLNLSPPPPKKKKKAAFGCVFYKQLIESKCSMEGVKSVT